MGFAKAPPGLVADDIDPVQIVHPGAPQARVGPNEAARLDDIDADRGTGGQPQDRAGVLGYVGLIEGETHGYLAAPVGTQGGFASRANRIIRYAGGGSR